jgi:membrane-bound ClpP family serine protease
VNSVPREHKKVDVFLATGGGLAQQVVKFVGNLRARFEEVDFLIPSSAMSAGTLFALSGDRVWMNPHACLGPIDPQIPTRDGRFVPAQALLFLVSELQKQGQEALAKGDPPPWTAVRIIDTIDKKELGDAMTASEYSATMATQFLNDYKLRHWTKTESTGTVVTAEFRKRRAREVGEALARHDRWKSHGHAISREVLWNEIRLRIDIPDMALERAIRRTWAICHWVFDRLPVHKMMLSQNYTYLRHSAPVPPVTTS